MSRTRTDCEGLHRRDFLTAGAAGLFGLSLHDMLRAEAAGDTASARRPATGVIQIWLSGGPATIDMWDLKPEAPEEIRGEFRPIDTAVPGVSITEHMPRLASADEPLCAGALARPHDLRLTGRARRIWPRATGRAQPWNTLRWVRWRRGSCRRGGGPALCDFRRAS